jgi:glycosyltransferase involved in cell wall biosynthesis
MEFPKEQKSRILRYYYEYFMFGKFSRQNDIYMWISLNDKTPRVDAKYQFVYCHNPSMFYKPSIKDIYFSITNLTYALFYKRLYKHNIERNSGVIVQQRWIAEAFRQQFPIKKIYVMKPEFSVVDKVDRHKSCSETIFIYPTAPRSFKNCEVICEASKLLQKKGISDYKIYLTVKGDENRYARYLHKKYGEDKRVIFNGFVSRSELEDLYAVSDCLLFPSKLETWGLPMTEFRRYDRNIIAADLPYAHETLEGYGKAAYFEPKDACKLASLMEQVIQGKTFESTQEEQHKGGEYCYISSWTELIESVEDRLV